MKRIVGEFAELDDSYEYVSMEFSARSRAITSRWQCNGLSADFIAEYWGLFSLAHDPELSQQQAAIKSSVAFIANELLENAMKFTLETAEYYPIQLIANVVPHELRLYVKNKATSARVQKLQIFVQNLLKTNLDEFYHLQVEQNLHDPTQSTSCLGLLSIMANYNTQMAWKFEYPSAHRRLVTTMVRLFMPS